MAAGGVLMTGASPGRVRPCIISETSPKPRTKAIKTPISGMVLLSDRLRARVPGTSTGLGAWSGERIYRKTSSRAVGWIAGIIIFLLVSGAILFVGLQIPGVGWRIEKMMQHSDGTLL